MNMSNEEVRNSAESLAKMPAKPTAGMHETDRVNCIEQMLFDLRQLAENDGCIAAAWAYELATEVAAELDRREKEAAERALPLLGNVVPGFFDESDTWRVEHVITGVGKTAILLTDRRNGQQVRLGCIKTQGQLGYLLAALKGGET